MSHIRWIALSILGLVAGCSSGDDATSTSSSSGNNVAITNGFEERLLATIPEGTKTKWHRFSRDGRIAAYIATGPDGLDRLVVDGREGEAYTLI